MFVVKTWKERIGLMNSEPFRAFIGVEWEMQAEIDELRAALAQQAEPSHQVSWNLNYKDSTPKLNVMHSAFEDWFQQQPLATREGVKQLCRDSYAAGMGDPLVTYAAPQVAQQAEHFAASEYASHPFNDVWHEVHEE